MGKVIDLTEHFRRPVGLDFFSSADEPDFDFQPTDVLAHPDLVVDTHQLEAFVLTLRRHGNDAVRYKAIGHAIDAALDLPGISDEAFFLLHAIGDTCRMRDERYMVLCAERLDAMTGGRCRPIKPLIEELARLARIQVLSFRLPQQTDIKRLATIVVTSSDRTLGALPYDVTHMLPEGA